MNILVSGSNGQLGTELSKRQHKFSNWNFLFTDYKDLDICNTQQIEKFIQNNSIDVLINCAAYTAVDRAESDLEKATAVNTEGPGIIAQVCEKHKIQLIHVSTDFVFDGHTHLPYSETDQPNPLNVYGLTKLKGEQAVLSANPTAIILRTAWLYSAHGNNFVKTMQRLGRERTTLSVIFDQVGTPTWAGDLAEVILTILNDPETGHTKKGLYHFSNEGTASWYDFAWEIMHQSHINCLINPIETSEYPTPAKRPAYSVLNKRKIKKDFSIQIPHWKDSLEKCLKELNQIK